MRILVVCGAGASSTFVAQRLRHAAHAAGRQLGAVAGTRQSLAIDLDAADVVLVGPHLHDEVDDIRRDASMRGVAVVLLPEDVFTDLDGTRTLALVDAATPPDPPAQNPPAAQNAPARRSPA